MTSSELIDSEVIKDKVDVKIKDPNGEIINMTADVVLSAVGIKSNIEDLGLENLDIKTEKDKILVDDFYKTIKERYKLSKNIFIKETLRKLKKFKWKPKIFGEKLLYKMYNGL